MKPRPKILEEQRYSVYRDLSSWVASFGGVIRDNQRSERIWPSFHRNAQGIPEIWLRLNFDPASQGQ